MFERLAASGSRERGHQGMRRSARPPRRRRALAISRSSAICAPAGRCSPELRDRGRAPSGGRGRRWRATARPSSPTIAISRPPRGRRKRGRIWLVTGPNMAGKSTFLRQNALIAILAQMGAFVPARARISASSTGCSRASAPPTIWRAGARPSWSRWWRPRRFSIRRPRALVILDEIGRGTATFDGLSIAWAASSICATSIARRALFATHFHELTALSARLPRLQTSPCG